MSGRTDPGGVDGAGEDRAAQEATRQRLVDATMQLLGGGGNHSLRLADVARETGVAVSTIYAHFRDRTDLLAAARLAQFKARAEESLRVVDAAIELASDGKDLAEVLVWPTLLSPEDEGARERRWDRIEAIADARHMPELADRLRELQSALTARASELAAHAQARGLIDPTLDPAALAMLSQVMRLGLILWDLAGDERPSVEAWHEVMLRVADAVTTPQGDADRAPAPDQPAELRS